MRTLSRTQQQMQQLGTLLKTAAGRQKLAGSLGPSLRRRRDYMSIARKALMVEVLPDGALPIYDKEFDETGRSFIEAFVVGEEGGDIVRMVKPKRVTVPTFDIVANPMIPITQIKERRFDVVERSLNLAKAEIGATEDGYTFGLFDTVADTANTTAILDSAKPVTDPTNYDLNHYVYNRDWLVGESPDKNAIRVEDLADAFGQIERHDLSPAYIFMNPKDYTDLRKWTADHIDRETERKLLKTGVMGYVWGTTILQSRKVKNGVFYILGDAEFLGVIPERIPLTVMSADRPDLRQIGFSIFQNSGQLIFGCSAIQRCVKKTK